MLSPCVVPAWLLTEEGVDPAREREVESLFAIANGYMGARAAIAEGGRLSRPSTFVAGIYAADRDLGLRLAVFPHWLHVEVMVEDQWLSVEAGPVLAHRRGLDLRQGVLWREWRQRDPSGRITQLTYLQLASLADRHLLLQSVAVTAENYAGRIGLTTRLTPSDVKSTDIEDIVAESGAILLRVAGREIGIADAFEPQGLTAARPAHHEGGAREGEKRWSWDASLGETIRLDRMFAIFTSRDVASPTKAACDHLASTRAHGALWQPWRRMLMRGAADGKPPRFGSRETKRRNARFASRPITLSQPLIPPTSMFRSVRAA
jgi:Glycosyl hydrolase family 65, N-terminal domain